MHASGGHLDLVLQFLNELPRKRALGSFEHCIEQTNKQNKTPGVAASNSAMIQ